MKAFLLVIMLTFAGCHHTDVKPRECPTFDAKMSIMVEDHNATAATISWDDVSGIETFLKRKKTFNDGVKRINDELSK